MNRSLALLAGTLAAAPALGCAASPDLLSLLAALPAPADQDWHIGPDVHVDETGPARFVGPLNEAFQPERAMRTVRLADRYYRAPANSGYDAVLDHLIEELRAAGFAAGDPRLRLEILEEQEEELAWEPRSAEVTLLVGGEEQRTLHAFDASEDVDRVMLPINAPACELEAEIALHLDELRKGMVLVTDVSATQVLRRAQSRGAAAVVSASLAPFNIDPSGKERHLEAIHFRTLPQNTALPVFQISPRSLQAIEAAMQRAATEGKVARLRLKADVVREERPLRTVVATIAGASRPDEAVVMASHVQEPGASDNASGVGGLLESARVCAELFSERRLPWPERSLVFIWGDEFRQSETWLRQTDMEPVVGVSSDMTGQSRETGAIALLERTPDPGAVFLFPPDAHTPWGAGEVGEDDLHPNGLAVIARCAMIDVGLAEEEGWRCADHPWEGGSDHDVFNERGIPAVLFWHFTDFTYHTSLDRLGFVDPQEIRRTGVAILATALAVANPEPQDLDRYLQSLDIEQAVRVDAAHQAESEEAAALWTTWCRGARNWLRQLCLGTDDDLPEGGAR